jgi:hypothetical protein
MSYTITKTDGTVLTTIADGTLDSTSSLELPGPNYVGYGQKLDENLVYLLENFAGNTAPGGENLQGQLWFNKSNQTLNVFTTEGYLPVSGLIISSSQPVNANPGNTYYNTSTNQYYFTPDGVNWNLIGPQYTKAQGVSGAIPVVVGDGAVAGQTHNIIQLKYGNVIMATLSSDPSFPPASTIPGFSVINPGLTFNSNISTPIINTNINGQLTGNVIGSLTGAAVVASNLFGQLTGNVVGSLTGAVVSATNIFGSLTGNVSSITSSAVNFSSGNAQITGGSITGETNISSISGSIANFSSGNAQITGGNATGLTSLVATNNTFTNVVETTAFAVNFSTGNAQITGGNSTVINANATTVTTTNLNAGNAQITGGNLTGMTSVSASSGFFTGLTTGALLATSGNISGLTNISATNGTFTNLNTGTITITGGNISGANVSGTTLTGVSLVNSTATTKTYSDNSTAIATTAFVQSVLPRGMIVMWGGAVANIPAGWQLCNGSNGTPNLEGQFIVGAGGSYNPGAQGGAATATLSSTNLPSHSHTISGLSGSTSGAQGTGWSSSGHNHGASTTVIDPQHQHLIYTPGGQGSVNLGNDLVGNGGTQTTPVYTAPASTGISASTSVATTGDHTHTISLSGGTASSGGGAAFGILPPYYALCYIQKMY